MQRHEHKEISLNGKTYSFHCHAGSQFHDIVKRWEDELWVFYTVSDDSKEWQTAGKVLDNGRLTNQAAAEWIASLESDPH